MYKFLFFIFKNRENFTFSPLSMGSISIPILFTNRTMSPIFIGNVQLTHPF
jgi:hypothetical protein